MIAKSLNLKNFTMQWPLWLAAFRPKTLSAAVVPILVGTALASKLKSDELEIWISIFALASAVCIQIATNLVNDAKDFQKGADREDRLGPMRVTQAGYFSSSQVMSGAVLFFALATLFGIPLVMAGGLPILVVGLLSLLAGYAYTGGPFPLAYRGLGDLFVFLFFGVIAVAGMTYLLYGQWSWSSFLAGAQIGMLSTVLIAINNLRDVSSDTRANKKTLAVRFGERFVRFEISTLLFTPYLLLGLWSWNGYSSWIFMPFITLPLGLVIAQKIWTTPPGVLYNRYLGMASLHHVLFGVLLAMGIGVQ